jgi:hypothetical protein
MDYGGVVWYGLILDYVLRMFYVVICPGGLLFAIESSRVAL